MTPNPTQDALFTALRAFIASVVPVGVEIVQGLGNGVPMPDSQFVCMTAAAQHRLATNSATYDPNAGTRTVTQPTQFDIQVDCYGPDSSDYATTISAMLRDPYGCDMLAPYGCQPLYTSDPTQSALVNGEENYEQRWMLTAMLQFNPTFTVSQQFADALQVGFTNADAPTN